MFQPLEVPAERVGQVVAGQHATVLKQRRLELDHVPTPALPGLGELAASRGIAGGGAGWADEQLARRRVQILSSPGDPPVRLDAVRKTYGRGNSAVTALDGVTVDFPAGTFTAVMGPSGSGKSTLLHCLAGLDGPTSGSVTLVGTPLAGKSETSLTLLRRRHVAFVFQSFNLMPALNVWQNVTCRSC